MHYSIYRYSMQVLQDAVQQLMLVPLDEMAGFVVGALEVSGDETALERQKLKAAEDQLELIRLAQSFSNGVNSLLESTQRRIDLG